jgi:hypothetical protein
LGQKQRNNSPALWIRTPGAFEAIVEPDMFTKAQERRMQRRFCLSNREMPARLSSLLREKGHRPIIDEAENLPSHCTYIARFGSLRNAYKLIGHVPEASFRYIDARRLIVSAQTEIANKLVGDIRAVGRSAIFDEKTGVLTIDGKVTISILIFSKQARAGTVAALGYWTSHRSELRYVCCSQNGRYQRERSRLFPAPRPRNDQPSRQFNREKSGPSGRLPHRYA